MSNIYVIALVFGLFLIVWLCVNQSKKENLEEPDKNYVSIHNHLNIPLEISLINSDGTIHISSNNGLVNIDPTFQGIIRFMHNGNIIGDYFFVFFLITSI